MTAVSDDSETGRGAPARTQTDGTGIGELLRDARERRGLTLEQVSRETRIPRRHLEAIERDNLAALPGPFYQRAQIRTYARALHLDPDLAVAPLDRRPPPPVPDVLPQPPIARTPPRGLSRRALIASGVVLAAVALWRWIPREISIASPPEDAAASTATAIDRTAPDRVEPASASTDGPLTGVSQPPAPTERVEKAVSVRTAPAKVQPIVPAKVQPIVPAKGNPPAAATQSDAQAPVKSATELVVATQPAGAQVTVDGIGWGVTPVTIRFLPPGNKRVRVSKDGYATSERVVALTEGRRRTTDIRLAKEP